MRRIQLKISEVKPKPKEPLIPKALSPKLLNPFQASVQAQGLLQPRLEIQSGDLSQQVRVSAFRFRVQGCRACRVFCQGLNNLNVALGR